jgi:N-acetyl-anhydromuramyl-L-alanine amidase AmpD
MLGVEFLGDTSQRDLTPEQIQSYVEYVKPIIRQYQIPLENITTHENVRKEYNKWASENGQPNVPDKPDITASN